ncbi:hypothetical protein LINPERPRIM_LOCUS20326 [Linum perenne]
MTDPPVTLNPLSPIAIS